MLTGMALAATAAPQVDTVVPVRPGSRLDLQTFSGEVEIRTWNRREMRIWADVDERGWIDVSTAGNVVSVRPRTNRGHPGSVDWRLTIPTDMDIELRGSALDVTALDVGGSVLVETTHGDVTVRGGKRFVTIHSVSGDIDVNGVQGRVEVGATSGDIIVRNVRGELAIGTTNGDIDLSDIVSDLVQVTTVNGDVGYDGAIRPTGRYVFNTHNGDLTVAVPADASATVNVTTFNGEFRSAFPVTLTQARSGPRQFSFVLGSGAAQLELKSFGGEIHLVRPGAFRRP